MSYVQDSLMPKEKVLLSAHIHPAVFLPCIVLLAIAASTVFCGLAVHQPVVLADEPTYISAMGYRDLQLEDRHQILIVETVTRGKDQAIALSGKEALNGV